MNIKELITEVLKHPDLYIRRTGGTTSLAALSDPSFELVLNDLTIATCMMINSVNVAVPSEGCCFQVTSREISVAVEEKIAELRAPESIDCPQDTVIQFAKAAQIPYTEETEKQS